MIHVFKKLLALIFILLIASSCDKGCVEAYQFDSDFITVDSYPVSDGVKGTYSNVNGGQSADWHETNLRTNGDPIIISLSGAWTSWNTGWTGVSNDAGLQKLEACKPCFKKNGVNNCICAPGQNPVSEPVSVGKNSNDCSDATGTSNQNNSTLCTCTKQSGSIYDSDDIYYIALNYQDKDGKKLESDKQKECKFDKGLGLYIGLFGPDGNDYPKRLYHLYSYTQICDVPRTNGKCVDDQGNDVTRYLYQSPGGKIFVKDTLGNDDPADDIYHTSKEFVKVKIYDQYYADNYGVYNLTFLGGVIKDEDKGILEYIVGTFEDIMLGKFPDNCKTTGCTRSGGAVEFMYKAIVSDTTVIFLIQLLLVLYLTLFGIGTLAGVVEITKKELMKRALKIGLVIFFTSQTSWQFYNQFVIGFFKDSMDFIISMFMSFSDKTIFTDSSGDAIQTNSIITTAQLDRQANIANATRFAYADLVIKQLYSAAVAQKVWSLFFGTIFGVLYIPLTYFLIGYFTFTVLTVALAYVVAMIKLIFVIALGPLFIIASLYSQTEGMFKKWLAFMAARSMEIMVIFIIFYMFLVLISQGFTELLTYRSCVEPISFGNFSINVPKVYISRSFIAWLTLIMKIGALIFILKMILDKIPMFIGSMVTVGGTAGMSASTAGEREGVNTNAFGIAKGITTQLLDAARKGMSRTLPTVLTGIRQGIRLAADAAGISVKGPMSIMGNSLIDQAIKNATSQADSQGLTGQDRDKAIREGTFNYLYRQIDNPHDKSTIQVRNPIDQAKLEFYGVNAETIAQRLNDRLINDAIKKSIKERTKEIRNQNDSRSILVGSEAESKFRQDVFDDVKKQSAASAAEIEKAMGGYKRTFWEKSQLDPTKAGKIFKNDIKGQLKYIEGVRQYKKFRQDEMEKYDKRGIKDTFRKLSGRVKLDEEAKFIRGAEYAEGKERGWNPLRHIAITDLFADKFRTKAKKDLDHKAPKGIAGSFKRLVARGAMDFKSAEKQASLMASEDFLLNGRKAELDRISRENKAEIDRFNAGQSNLSLKQIEQKRKYEEDRIFKITKDSARELEIDLKDRKDSDASDVAARGNIAGQNNQQGQQNPQNQYAEEAKFSKSLEDIKNSTDIKQQDKSLIDLKTNMADYYEDQVKSLKTDIDDLKSRLQIKEREMHGLEGQRNLTDDQKTRLEQLKFEVSRDQAKLSVKQSQSQRMEVALASAK